MKILFPSISILIFLVGSGIGRLRKTCEEVASLKSDWPSDYCDTWKKKCEALNDMTDFDRILEDVVNRGYMDVLAKQLSAGKGYHSSWTCKSVASQFKGECVSKFEKIEPIDCVKNIDGQMLDVLIGRREKCQRDEFDIVNCGGAGDVGLNATYSLREGSATGYQTISGFDSSTKVLYYNTDSDDAKCSSKKSCDITAFRISCQSNYYDPNEKYAGVIIYDAGTYNKGRRWGRIYPGYTMLFNTKNQKLNSAREGQVHGWAIRKKFGDVIPKNEREVEYMENKYKMKFGGFSVQKGVLKIGSGSMNYREKWHKGNSNMGMQEAYIVHSLVNFWKTKKRIAVNIPVDQLYKYVPRQIEWTIENNSTSYDTSYKL